MPPTLTIEVPDMTAEPRPVDETSTEPPAAILQLPNALAYTIAAFGGIVTLILPFALAAGGLSVGQALDRYYLNSAVGFAVLGALILRRRRGHAIGWILVTIGGFDALVRFSNGCSRRSCWQLGLPRR